MFNLFKKRIYDIGVITDKSVKVQFNGETLPVKHLKIIWIYILVRKSDAKRVFEKVSERWEICMFKSIR